VQLRNPIAGQIEQKLLLNLAMDIRLFEVGAPREAAPSPRKRRAMGAGATGSSSGSGALTGEAEGHERRDSRWTCGGSRGTVMDSRRTGMGGARGFSGKKPAAPDMLSYKKGEAVFRW
jgi:hypothetical protein